MSDDFLKNPASLFDIRGKTAIVTGASGAFGALASKVLAGAGANVVLAARRVDKLYATSRLVEGAGRRALTVATDVTDPAQCQAMVDAAMDRIEWLGRFPGSGRVPVRLSLRIAVVVTIITRTITAATVTFLIGSFRHR